MNEKKIKSEKNLFMSWMHDAIKYSNQLEKENNEKKIITLNKKIERCKSQLLFEAKIITKLGGSIDDLIDDMDSGQKAIMCEIFPNGIGGNRLLMQARANSVIKKYRNRINKLKDVESKYEPYDPTLPVKEKLKNRIYKAEVNIGWYMVLESKKTESTYEPAWNYEEHFATTVEFTEEEREFIERCYEVGKEYDAYNDERFAFLETIGNGLQTFARSYGETSDRLQAEKWAEKLYTDIFPRIIDIAAPGRKFSSKEMETISRGLTKKMLEFVADDSRLESALATWESLRGEADVKLQQLNDAACAQFRGIGGARERILRAGVDRMIGTGVDSRRVMMIELMKERAGADEAYFTFIYTEMPDQERFRRIMTKYSPEELGV